MNPLSRRTFLGWVGASAATGGLAEVSGVAVDSWDADVCVYGATASGVAAAMSAADAGARVMMIEPSRWLGGMSGGGLSAIDWGNRRTVGGMAKKLLLEGDDPGMRELYRRELAQRGIPVLFEHRLGGVTKEHGVIRSVMLDHAPPDRQGCPIAKPLVRNAKVATARVFIDCSYEGDLMAKAGVGYTWGRESRDEYGETLAGVRPVLVRYAIDPYVKPGDPRSGLLPLWQDVTIGPLGSADKLTMAYAFRWHLASKDDPIRLEAPAFWCQAILARMINDVERSSCDHHEPLNISVSRLPKWKLPSTVGPDLSYRSSDDPVDRTHRCSRTFGTAMAWADLSLACSARRKRNGVVPVNFLKRFTKAL